MSKSRSKLFALILLLVAVGGGFILWRAYYRWHQAGKTAVARGETVARHLGCFACHGPGAIRGIPNPGSDVEHVPSWDGGTAMMYVKNDAEIREWILDGMARRVKEERASAETRRSL